MTINPIWVREMRARWRGWRAFALLFSYVAILGGVLLWRYGDFLSGYEAQEIMDPNRRMARLGHELFLALILLQAGLWMLLAPILTATSITSERERGLMESLHLSHLNAREIVIGKLLSALSFVALLILVTLPIEAICFLMGGVSPGEFLLAMALHASTAIAFAALGLVVSAWSRKSVAALSIAIILSLMWSGASLTSVVALEVFYPPPYSFSDYVYLGFCEALGRLNPIYAAYLITEPEPFGPRPNAVINALGWLGCFLFSGLSSLALLWLASCGARRVLGGPRRIEWSRFRRDLEVPQVSPESDGVRSPSKAKPSRRWELGFLARWQFSNPVLGREFRACFRPRSSSPFMVILAILLAPVAIFAYGVGMYLVITQPDARAVLPIILFFIFLALVIFFCAVSAASAFAREREQSTLTALRLSLLTPRELITGKASTPLVVCAVCGVVFLPMIVPAVRSLVFRPNQDSISLTQFLGALLLIGATAWCMTMIGLVFSWFNRRVVAATCWTIGTLFAIYVAFPVLLLSTVSGYPQAQSTLEFLRCFHPFYAMFVLFERRIANPNDGYAFDPYRASTLADAASSSFVLCLIGATLLFILWRGVLDAQDGTE